MPSQKSFIHPDLADVSISQAMQALADPSRVAIISALSIDQSREFACNEIHLDIELSKATISHHFKTLREAGIIMTRVEGRNCLSSIRTEEFTQRFPGLLELVLSECP